MDVVIGGPTHDVLSDIGYSNSLFQCLNLRPGSGCWLAPVCSTWVFMFVGCTYVSLFMASGFNIFVCVYVFKEFTGVSGFNKQWVIKHNSFRPSTQWVAFMLLSHSLPLQGAEAQQVAVLSDRLDGRGWTASMQPM